MTVMEEGYHALVHECPMITTRQKQTIFGRTRSVVSFTNTFYAELVTSAECYLKMPAHQIGKARFDELLGWDAETTVGETFWSTVCHLGSVLTVDGEDRESVYRILYPPGGSVTDYARAREERSGETVARGIPYVNKTESRNVKDGVRNVPRPGMSTHCS